MAEQYRYFGSAVGDTRTYNQAEFAEVLYTIIKNGYLGQELNELLVTESTPAGMSVTVKSGKAWLNGYWYQNDANKVITLAAANTSPRIDTIILRLDTINARSIVATVVYGTPASVPVPPTLTQTNQMFEFPLCDVYVGAGVSSILNTNITDRRVQSLLQDTDEILAQVASKAPLSSPTFTGNVSLPSTTSIGTVSSTEISYIDGLTSSAQTQLNSKAITTTYTATIPYTSWTGSSAPFSKAVTVSGILSTDTPIIDIVQTGTYATDTVMVADWAKIYRGVVSTDTITFYATAVPTADISIQVKVVR